MTLRAKIFAAAALVVAVGFAVLLREEPDPTLPLTELRSSSSVKRFVGDPMLIGGGRTGWGV